MQQLGPRPFAFFPPILGLEHNEWRFREATWSEVAVINTKTNAEIWVPRRFIGDLSSVDEPIAIIGLTKELEFKGGIIAPHTRRLLEMPRAVNEGPRPLAPDEDVPPAPKPPPVDIGLSSSAERGLGKLLLGTVAVAIAAVVLVVAWYQSASNRIRYDTVLQSDVTFGPADTYHAVVRRLGTPETDQWSNEANEIQYRSLGYSKLGISVILMGGDRDSAKYIGQINKEGKVVHSINPDMERLLRRLKKF